MNVDISKELGSTLSTGSKQIVIFIPEKSQLGRKIKQQYWVDEALKVLSSLFRGATAFPPGKGAWRKDESTIIIENSVMVVSYVDPKLINPKNLKVIRSFLHKMGREANQGEIGIVIDGRYYPITEYDKK